MILPMGFRIHLRCNDCGELTDRYVWVTVKEKCQKEIGLCEKCFKKWEQGKKE